MGNITNDNNIEKEEIIKPKKNNLRIIFIFTLIIFSLALLLLSYYKPLDLYGEYTNANESLIDYETYPSHLLYSKWDVSDEESPIGYKVINNTLMIWNLNAPYYFNKSSGIQFTNHYEKYWTRNIFCLGYYSGGTCNKIKCADELSNFNKNIHTDNLTYVNATLWKDFTYSGYDLRFGVRYPLKLDDKNLSITISIKNQDDEDIPTDLCFMWKVMDIEIPVNVGEDKILINDSYYELDGYNDLWFKNMSIAKNITMHNNVTNTSYSEMVYDAIPFYRINDGREYLKLDWNKNLDYGVKLYSEGDQSSAYVMVAVNAGSLNIGQEKSTTFYWIDAEGDFLGVWFNLNAANTDGKQMAVNNCTTMILIR